MLLSCLKNLDHHTFEGRNSQGQFLKEILYAKKIGSLWIGGLATEYCVKSTAIDGLKAGLKIFILLDAVQGINLSSSDSQNAIEEMTRQNIGTVKIQSAPT